MSKLTNLLIPIIISTGIISCTSQSLVRESDVRQQARLQHEGKDVISQTGYSDIPTKRKATDSENDASTRKAINRIRKPKPVIFDYTNTIESGPAHGEFTTVNLTEKTEMPTELEESEGDNGKKDMSPVGLAHLNLGVAYAERDLIDQAILEFQSAIKANPHHLESHVRLGTTYVLKGMTNEALSEFKKAIDINLNEAVAKIVFNTLPVAANQNVKTDVVKAHINLGNAYKEEGKLKRSQLEYEKALELKPEHPIARRSLSEIYYNLGTSHLENKEYDNALDEFNKVLELNPGFSKIRDVLEKTHYNLGVNYVKNKELDKAIMEFNKAIGINPNYAKLDKNIFSTISKGKKIIFGKPTHHGRNHSSKNIRNSSTTNDVGKEGSHKEEKESKPLHKQIPHEIGVSEEIILAEKGNAKESEYDQNQVENQHSLLLSQEDNKSKLVQSNKALFETGQLKKADDSGHEKVQLKIEISNEDQGKKQIQEEIAHVKTVDTEETDDNILTSTYIVPGEIKRTSGHRIFSYYITRNYNSRIGFKDAIKKYENATRKNHYDNTAFLSLAHAYYSKAMHLDYAIARREEDAPGSTQNFLVQRYYLNDDVGDEVVSRVSSTEQTKILEEYNMTFHNKLGNVYHKREMFSEAIKEYKNALKIDPNSSKTLYSLAFSFSKKGSYPGIALRSKSNSKRTLSGF